MTKHSRAIVSTLLYLSLVLAVVTSSAAHAATVTFTTFDANGNGPNTNVGTFTVTTTTAGTSTIYSFTRTGNLDGGTVNDTMNFDLTYTIYTGSTIGGGNVTLGTPVALANTTNPHYMNNYVGDPNTNAVELGDSFTATISNLSYTSGEGFGFPALAFDGFHSIRKFGGGATDVLVGTSGATTFPVPSATGSTITLGSVPSLAFTAGGTSGQRWRDLNFSFTVPDIVPEPSRALLSLFGLAIVLLRRRR